MSSKKHKNRSHNNHNNNNANKPNGSAVKSQAQQPKQTEQAKANQPKANQPKQNQQKPNQPKQANQHNKNQANKNQPKKNQQKQQASKAVQTVEVVKDTEAVEAVVETFDDVKPVIEPAEKPAEQKTEASEKADKSAKATEAAKAETADKQEEKAEASEEAAEKSEKSEETENAENTESKKRGLIGLKKNSIALIAVFGACLLLNIIVRLSTPFADFYLDHIFPIWNNTFGRLLSWLPFSVGEILIIIAVAGLPISLIVYIVLMCIKKGKRKRVSHIYFKTLAWCVAYVLVTETLNCFIMYQCSTFASKNGISEETYTTSQLLDVYEKLIEQTNEASSQIQRDENGKFILTADLDKTAAATMENISGDYPILKGFYTKPKPVINSYFMSQQYLMGVYFPFTLEANYNKLMYDSNKPETVVHELAHTQGIILEDEANFVSFLACSQSENAEYRYSGYLSALKYVRTRAFDAVQDKDPALRERLDEMETHIDYGIWVDMFENQAYWQDVQEDEEAIIPSSTVNELADAAMNGSLKFNGVADGKDSYGRMVDLLLNYYYDKGLV